MKCRLPMRIGGSSGSGGGGSTTPSGPFAVVISGEWGHPYWYYNINGKDGYLETTLEISAGTEINIVVDSQFVSWGNSVTIKHNGATVQNGGGTYTFIPTSNVTMNSTIFDTSITVTITTE